MKKNFTLSDISSIFLDIQPGCVIFLKGDLGSGKTTFSKHIINTLLKISDQVNSPTYNYYNKYGENIYHFDLYRLNNYDEFFAIGGEDIFDNRDNIILVEWPEIIEKYIRADIEIFLEKTNNPEIHTLEIVLNNR